MTEDPQDMKAIVSADPPHQWGKDLRCKLCNITAARAREIQPETKGVGPCLVAQAMQRMAKR